MFQEKYKLEDVQLGKEATEHVNVIYMFHKKYKLADVILGKEVNEYVKVISKSQDLKLQ